MSLFKAITGIDTGTKRRARDNYYSTEECVQALLAKDGEALRILSGGKVWEPCCGDGGISKPLRAAGFETVDTDLIDGSFGTPGVNFLHAREALARALVTNPPFGPSARMIRHIARMMERGMVEYAALLLKATYFNSGVGLDLFEAFEPAMVIPLTWRVDFTGGGASPMDMSWYVWREHPPGVTLYRPVERPGGKNVRRRKRAEPQRAEPQLADW